MSSGDIKREHKKNRRMYLETALPWLFLSQSCLQRLSSLDCFSISLNNELVLCDHKIDKTVKIIQQGIGALRRTYI